MNNKSIKVHSFHLWAVGRRCTIIMGTKHLSQPLENSSSPGFSHHLSSLLASRSCCDHVLPLSSFQAAHLSLSEE